jgi:hypothetical protein
MVSGAGGSGRNNVNVRLASTALHLLRHLPGAREAVFEYYAGGPKGVGLNTTGSSLIFQWKWTRHDWQHAGSRMVLQIVYYYTTLVVNSRVRVVLYRTVHLGVSFFEGGLSAVKE